MHQVNLSLKGAAGAWGIEKRSPAQIRRERVEANQPGLPLVQSLRLAKTEGARGPYLWVMYFLSKGDS
jgi:hypothetical protein